MALAHGRLDGPATPLVRVHVADTLRDLLGVQRCGARLDVARGACSASSRRAAAWSSCCVSRRPPRELADAVRSFAAASGPDGGAKRSATEGRGGGAAHLRCRRADPQGPRRARMRVLSAPKQMHGISAFGLEIEGYVGEEG